MMASFKQILFLIVSLYTIFIKGSTWYVANNIKKSCDNTTNVCASLFDALTISSSGDFIYFKDGIFSGSGNTELIINTPNIFISSINGPSRSQIMLSDSSFAYQIMAYDVQINGLTFYNATSSSQSIISTQFNLIIDNCHFINNKIIATSGVLNISRAFIVIIANSTFINNTLDPTYGLGASIYIDSSTNVAIYNSLFLSGEANLGGAIYAIQSELLIQNCSFNGNTAYYDGGDIYAIQHSQLSINASTFRLAKAGHNGGSIDIHASSFQCSFSAFERSSAQSSGGAISLENITDSIINNIQINSCTAITMNGGGLFVAGKSKLHSDLVVYYNNSAFIDGGAISASSSRLYLTNDTLKKNKAGIDGGGLYVSSDSIIHLLSVNITDNESNDGGGIFCSDASMYINKTSISNNIDNSNTSNLYCSLAPYGTYCQVSGDSNWNSQCGLNLASDNLMSNFKIILLGAVGALLLVCIGTIVLCISWRWQLYKKRKLRRLDGRNFEEDGMELLTDYDEVIDDD